MKLIATVSTLLLSSLMVGCSSMSVSTDFDPNYAFSDIKTFILSPPKEHSTESNDLVRRRIENAIVTELEKKGMQQSDEGEADIMVSYLSTTERDKDIRTYQNYNNYYGYRGCYRCYGPGWGMGYSTTEVRTVEYVEGVLMIDLIDPQSKVLKWRGHTEARFTPRELNRMTAQEKTELVNEAVAAILSEFPPSQ